MNAAERTQWVTERARETGFDLCGVAPASDFEELARLPEWLARGYAGEMRYLRDPRRQSPAAALPGARSIIVCALNYNTAHPYSTEARHVLRDPRPVQRGSPDSAPFSTAPTRLKQTATSSASSATSAVNGPSHESPVTHPGPRGWISRYAWGDDYHNVLGKKLQRLLDAMRAEFGEPFAARAYVDTGPVVERIAAKYAGLGWLGKNTCLINERLGSWLFLGVILTTLDLTPSRSAASAPRQREAIGHGSSSNHQITQSLHHPIPPPDLCGNCTQCIDACPTGAIVEPYVLDARRCISYLTIELRGSIPEELREAMGWHVFGCDICQDVCPYNRRAPVTEAAEFQPRRIAPENGKEKIEEGKWKQQVGGFQPNDSTLTTGRSADSLFVPQLEWLAAITEDEFRRIFSGSAVKRTKWRGLVRNACVALENAHSAGLQACASESAQIIALLEKLAHAPDALIADAARRARDRVQAAAAKS